MISRKYDLLKSALILMTFIIGFSSCATFGRKYADTEQQWGERVKDQKEDINHTLFFVGDAGKVQENKDNPVFSAIQSEVQSLGKNASLVFLGDNIYPHGLTPQGHKDRAEAQSALDAHLNLIKSFPGKSFIIPGNHDWAYEGLPTIERQAQYLDSVAGQTVLYPKNGCPGPETIELTSDLSLIIIDSQWYLEDWNRSLEINRKCSIKTRDDFIFSLYEEIARNKDKQIVLALHHPLKSYGDHGGKYPLRSHLFPLTDLNKNLILPLPILGSFVQLLKTNISKKQDLAHPLNKELVSGIMKAIDNTQDIISISGHEHSQQLIYKDGKYHIVSGSGSKTAEVDLGDNALFASGKLGFGKLEFFDSGRTWLTFYELDNEDKPIEVFRKLLSESRSALEDNFPSSFPEYESETDSVVASIYEEKLEEKKLYNQFFGKHYSSYYSTLVKAPVLDLFKYKDGLRPIKRGGSNVTNSLRLELADEKQYTMRALRKNNANILREELRGSALSKVLKDLLTSAHPYGAFVIHPMAEAAGIMHTHPELYYVPKQAALEHYNATYGNQLYLLEERPDGDMSHSHNFGNSPKVISTEEVLREIYTDKEARIDQHVVVRARLFDMLINDWDRHDDQWRWALKKEGNDEVYAPIPRDRDQAFSKFDGWVPALLRLTFPVFRQMQSFEDKVDNIVDMGHNSRWFDRSFLHEMEWEDWQKEVIHLQNSITDEVLEEVENELPQEIRNKNQDHLTSKLKKRLHDLDVYAWRYYSFLAQKIDIPGTEDVDSFFLNPINDNAIKVIVKSNSKVKYSRTISARQTSEIRLYGRGGADVFLIEAPLSTKITYYLLGGENEDEYNLSYISRNENSIVITDNNQQKITPINKITAGFLSSDPFYTTYNRKDFQYDYGIYYPTLGYNPDGGLMFGVGYTKTEYGFHKRPYKSKLSLLARAGFYPLSFNIRANKEIISVIGEKDLILVADLSHPQFGQNFFGFGNENIRSNTDINFYRMRILNMAFKAALQKRYLGGGKLEYGFQLDRKKIFFQENKFILTQENYENVYRSHYFGGAYLNFSFKNIDINHNPSRGLSFNATLSYKKGLRNSYNHLFNVTSELSYYQQFIDSRRLILAGRVGFSRQIGKVDVFNRNSLGGRTEIRGYRSQRFLGRSSLYVNHDLRLSLGEIKIAGIPFRYGTFVLFDIGRIYHDTEDSNTWHKGYGMGIWLSPIDIATICATITKGDSERRFTLRTGFFF